MTTKVATYARKEVSMFVLLNVAAVLLIGAAVFGAYSANAAATNKYSFKAKGIVREVNTHGNTIRIYINGTDRNSEKDLLGQTQDFNVRGAKFYKWVGLKKSRVTFSKTAQVGDEVSIKGVAKSNDEYNLTELTRNDRTFTVIGKLHNYDNSNRKLEITVESSTYKSKNYVGKDIWMQWGDNAKFKGGNKSNIDINSDEVSADEQRVKVVGSLEGNNWQVYNFYENYKPKT